ncbi:serine/threonine protein kinase [Proteus mirabilis]|uniref:Serine/threonine protein kinase n=1 Tax=Proteus mirabilis TaxID=584 RepID=A0A379GD86_PROMI|nr:serine/threonine protein kinase [Proteus mirabilis]
MEKNYDYMGIVIPAIYCGVMKSLWLILMISRMGSAIQDFWMLLSGSKQDQLIQLDTLLESYNEYQDFDVRELSLIEPLRAMRMVHYIAWVLKRWKDPAFPRTFVWFQEQDFWFKQLALFKGQVEQLNEPPLQLSPMY